LHRLRSLAHVIDMHQLSKDPEQLSPNYVPTAQSILHGLDADQLYHYLNYCSEMLSRTAKTSALCGEYSSDGVVLETISYIETLTTDLLQQDLAEDLAAPARVKTRFAAVANLSTIGQALANERATRWRC